MPKALTPDQMRAYRQEGVIFPIRVLTETEAASVQALFHAAIEGEGERRALRQPHLEHDWAYDLATRDAVLDPVEDLIGPDVIVSSTLVFYKPAGEGDYVSWHQDRLYPGLRTELVTAWIALSASSAANGCLRVIAGSHRQGIVDHREAPSEKNLLRQGQTIDDVDVSRALDLVLAPGEMSLHHGDLIHGSNANRSDTDRIGFVIRYVTPDVPPAPHAMIRARGSADCSHLRLLQA